MGGAVHVRAPAACPWDERSLSGNAVLANWLPRSPCMLLQAKGDLSGKLAGETIKPISDWVAR